MAFRASEYVSGGVAGVIGKKKKSKKKKLNTTESEISSLFAPITIDNLHNLESSNIKSQNLKVAEQLNKLALDVQNQTRSKRKMVAVDKVHEREGALRHADEPPKKKKKKKLLVESETPVEITDTVEARDIAQPVAGLKLAKLDRTTQRQNHKLKKLKAEKDRRTVFIGNLPISATKKTLLKLFRECGSIESIRYRSAAPANMKLPKKATVIKKEFHKNRHNIHAYILFKDEQSVANAVAKNGTVMDNFHIRVDKVSSNDLKSKHDVKRSIFIGNLSFDVEEETLREHFICCGEIEGVRIIRDRKTGLGKGFGYVLFQDASSVQLALKLNGQECCGRNLRVERAVPTASKDKAAKSSQQNGKGNKKRIVKMPTNVPASSFQGIKAKKLKKIKKKMKFKNKIQKKRETRQ